MADSDVPNILQSEGEPEGISGDNGKGSDCGVLEVQFPYMGKCCIKSSSISETVYIKKCSHCNIWTSLPYGADLSIAYIFRCLFCNYDKRIKE